MLEGAQAGLSWSIVLKKREGYRRAFSVFDPEVARYVGKYGSGSVNHAVIISGVPPFLLKTPSNPEGVDGGVFEGIQKAAVTDRYAFFTELFKNFYNTDVLLGKRVTKQAVRSSYFPVQK